MTRLLSASVLVALPSTQTDGAASLSSKTQRWPGEWRAQGAPGRILLMAQGTQKIFFPSSPTETFSVQSPLSARSLEKLEKSPRDIFHPEIQKDLLVLEGQEVSTSLTTSCSQTRPVNTALYFDGLLMSSKSIARYSKKKSCFFEPDSKNNLKHQLNNN
uniref:GTPase-activating Rap/Ran-GAP domain-like protein 3 isoform X1 n=1 Tax=Agelaius phoeniceus TaxID=39638 RepID=UPI0023EC734A|nr:GTPase-activating Rap/Ran-GAP domain-like protein 3 isoform X1 [Agelaius phoeniceus]